MDRYTVTWAPRNDAESNSKQGYAILDNNRGEIVRRKLSLERAERLAEEYNLLFSETDWATVQ